MEPDGITYFFAGGTVKIPLNELPETIRSKYSLTPERATAFQKSEEDAERRASEEKAANEEHEAVQHIVSNTFPILQVETDTADFVGQEFYVRGVIDISTSCLGKYSDDRETMYAFVISDGRSLCYCYAPKEPINNGVRLHEMILTNGKPVEGLFLLRIEPEKYRRGQPVLTAHFIQCSALKQ